MNKPTVRFRFNANGAQVFIPTGRQWLPIDEVMANNIHTVMYRTFGFRPPSE